MSRIGKKLITIPQGVAVEIKEGGRFGHKEVFVNGPKGSISTPFKHGVDFVKKENEIEVTRDSESKQDRAFHGLYRTLLQNMIDGVTTGFSKELEIVGIGYRAEMQGTDLVLSVGYSHKIRYPAPAGITITVAEQTQIKIEGYDKQLVGEVASKIRAFRKPEPYKGKGIRYKNERIKKKSTKSSK